MRIADLSTMTVQAQVSEADVPRLQVGMDVYFTTLGGGNRRWYGKLRQIPPTPTVVNNVVLYNALFDVRESRPAADDADDRAGVLRRREREGRGAGAADRAAPGGRRRRARRASARRQRTEARSDAATASRPRTGPPRRTRCSDGERAERLGTRDGKADTPGQRPAGERATQARSGGAGSAERVARFANGPALVSVVKRRRQGRGPRGAASA